MSAASAVGTVVWHPGLWSQHFSMESTEETREHAQRHWRARGDWTDKGSGGGAALGVRPRQMSGGQRQLLEEPGARPISTP
jgi:hypothetical protein